MGWIVDFFKNFRERYENQIIRNQKMDEFLSGARDNCTNIERISNNMNTMQKSIEKIDNKVNKITDDIDHINGRLEVIGKGTKMELFDTLYNWKKILVDDRGWASPAEKKEITHIYEIYHDELGGNGQGEIYYQQIMRLPEEKI